MEEVGCAPSLYAMATWWVGRHTSLPARQSVHEPLTHLHNGHLASFLNNQRMKATQQTLVCTRRKPNQHDRIILRLDSLSKHVSLMHSMPYPLPSLWTDAYPYLNRYSILYFNIQQA